MPRRTLTCPPASRWRFGGEDHITTPIQASSIHTHPRSFKSSVPSPRGTRRQCPTGWRSYMPIGIDVALNISATALINRKAAFASGERWQPPLQWWCITEGWEVCKASRKLDGGGESVRQKLIWMRDDVGAFPASRVNKTVLAKGR